LIVYYLKRFEVVRIIDTNRNSYVHHKRLREFTKNDVIVSTYI